MSYILASRYAGITTIPVSLPQLELRPGDSAVVSMLKIEQNQKMMLRWLSLNLIKLCGVNATNPTLINPGLGIVYAGVYSSGYNSTYGPCGTPIALVSVKSTGTSMINPYHPRNFESPDTYSIIVSNNTQSTTVNVGVSGSILYYFL